MQSQSEVEKGYFVKVLIQRKKRKRLQISLLIFDLNFCASSLMIKDEAEWVITLPKSYQILFSLFYNLF